MTARNADVASIDSIINAAYDVISGPAGKARDWDRERDLFFPGARLIPTRKDAGELNCKGSRTAESRRGRIHRARGALFPE